MSVYPVTSGIASPASQDITTTQPEPRKAPRQNPAADSIGSTTSNAWCLVRIWNAICKFFKRLCSSLCGRSNQGTRPEIIKPNIKKKPHIPLTQDAGQRTGNKPDDKSLGSAELPEAVREFLDVSDASAWFNSDECDIAGRVQILLHLANTGDIDRLNIYLVSWVRMTLTDSPEVLKSVLGVRGIGLIEQGDDLSKLIDYFNGLLKNLL